MPRKRKIPTRRRRGAIGDGKDVRHALRTGSCWFGDLFGSRDLDSPEADHEAIKAAWNDLRDAILEEWVAVDPGIRPWGWWRLDAPERRRRMGSQRWLVDVAAMNHLTPDPTGEVMEDDRPHPFDVPKRKAYVEAQGNPAFADRACRLSFGEPTIAFAYDETNDDFLAVYESEEAYLDRLGLLFDGELERIEAAELELADCT